jgi:hypothetical protein
MTNYLVLLPMSLQARAFLSVHKTIAMSVFE